LWDLSLVDPDNRRPVDFAARRALLSEVAAHGDAELAEICRTSLRRPADGRVKLLVTTRALHHRRRHRTLYDTGGYLALVAEGDRARNVVAFARTVDGDAPALTVVGRLFASIATAGELPIGEAAWGDTRLLLPSHLPRSRYRDVLTGSLVEVESSHGAPSLRLAHTFANLPVSILEPA
jgi:(1->4)-alpha-D-glucan 1-alpha-D-glucosylmutase